VPNDTIQRDTSVHGPSGEGPEGIGSIPDGPILNATAIAVATAMGLEPGIRLSHLNNANHNIRHPSGRWFNFEDHTLLIDEGDPEANEEIAVWIEDLIGRDLIKRDDLPHPIECLLCKAKGRFFTTKCLPFYSKHMLIAHQ
jgi:hypothetical protein